jgi:hypothetical protein
MSGWMTPNLRLGRRPVTEGNEDLVLWSVRDGGTTIESAFADVLGAAIGLTSKRVVRNGWKG